MSYGIYNSFRKDMEEGEVDFRRHTFRVALMNNNHKFRPSDGSWNKVLGNEIKGNGYIAGGKILRNIRIVEGNDDVSHIDADNTIWIRASFSTRYIVWYNSTTSKLVGTYDLERNYSVYDKMFTIVWHKMGLLGGYPL